MESHPDGWISMPGPRGTNVHMRVLWRDDGSMVVTDLYVHGEEITAQVLRELQPARVAAAASLGGRPHRDEHGQPILPPAELHQFPHLRHADDSDLTLAALRSRDPDPLGFRDAVREIYVIPEERTPIGRPDGTDPEQFYRRVADAYRSAAAESNRAASLLAGENGVPVETIRRWVKEARRRGMLPPGRKGRAG